MKPRLLDLFCGAGGAAVGYHRAGFEVVGVDIKPQPHYPFGFIQAEALWFFACLIEGRTEWPLGDHLGLGEIDAVHASPPCQAYIRGGLSDKKRHPDLVGTVRKGFWSLAQPWVIENVPGAPMRADAVLCGSMFGLPIRRHRWFEFSWATPMMAPATCGHSKPIAGVYGNCHGKAGAWKGMLPDTLETRREALGIDWMDASELALAIPPAYTELIGAQLLQHIQSERAA